MNVMNTLDILPKIHRNGYHFDKKIIDGRILVTYRTPGRIKKHIFPEKILLDEKFFIGFSLSIGDGLNNPSIQNTHYNFVNKNFYLVKIVYNWLINYFNIEEKDIQFQLFTNNKDNSNSINKIANLFHIKKNRIKVYHSNRHRGCTLVIQTSNRIFQTVYLNLFGTSKNKIINNTKFRRAFLKGLFAAEGHMKHSVYNTIESIHFCLNPKTESELADFIQECLLRENINSKNNKKGAIYFCGYENMLRFYLLGIMDIHEKKRNKFLKLIKNARFSLHFKENSLDFLRKFSQSKLAEILNCSQSSVCHMLAKNYLSLENLEILENKNVVTKKKLLDKISFVVVPTSYIRDKKSIEFLKNIIFEKVLSKQG